jgi:hypothetical protein
MNKNIWITPEQLAERLQIALGTLANWRTRRQGPKYIRLSGKRGSVRYRLDDVERWEQQQQEEDDQA